MGDCLKRAFETGLRSRGIQDEVPHMEWSEEIPPFIQKYGLRYICGESYAPGNNPVLIIYKSDFEGTDSKYHAVFCSDFAPFVRWEVHSAVVGWENL